jgi:hypothetical protein
MGSSAIWHVRAWLLLGLVFCGFVFSGTAEFFLGEMAEMFRRILVIFEMRMRLSWNLRQWSDYLE